MHFEFDVDIDAPPDTVWRIFSDPENLPRWQASLESYEAVSGEPGWPGAVSLLVYHEDGRRVEVRGTVLERSEGRHFAGRYENAWSVNDMVCRFEALPDGGTRWHAEAEYRLKGWVKILAPMLHDGLYRRLRDDMLRFKEMIEGEFALQPPVPPEIRESPRDLR